MNKIYTIIIFLSFVSCNNSKLKNESITESPNIINLQHDSTPNYTNELNNITDSSIIEKNIDCDSIPFLTYSKRSYPYVTGAWSDTLQLMPGFYIHKLSKQKYLIDFSQVAYELKGTLSRNYSFRFKDTLTLNSFTTCELKSIRHRNEEELNALMFINNKKHIQLYIEANNERRAKLIYLNPISNEISTLLLNRK